MANFVSKHLADTKHHLFADVLTKLLHVSERARVCDNDVVFSIIRDRATFS